MTMPDTRPKASPVVTQPFKTVEAAPLRLGITNVFGEPLLPSTWSGAPFNLSRALERLGAEVMGIYPRTSRRHDYWDVFRHVVTLGARPVTWNGVRRAAYSRTRRARTVMLETQRLGLEHVLHTGTLDLPGLLGMDEAKHYLYCDHTWNLVLRHHEQRWDGMSAGRLARVDEMERDAYSTARHIFTFGRYVRDNLIEHYGVPPERVTVVGSGMGPISPYVGPKDYAHGPLLFVAKQMFVEKGGRLVLKAFRLARRRRPDLRLFIAGNPRWRAYVRDEPGVHVFGHLPWDELQALQRSAALLVQPMFNDPWGQVYLEALASRTPVIGLDRNGLPEIIQDGRHGFLVPVADPVVLAETIIDALADPNRLVRMGESGQRHVLNSYSWEHVARVIYDTIGRV